MRIVLCDDDKLIIKQLEKIIKSYFKRNHLMVPEISAFFNGTDLLQDKGKKDIVFLDIEMPGMDGIFVGRELMRQNKNTLIFVVTSYAEYLDEAMRFHVFRYLSKPVDRQRLFRNLKDALEYYHNISIKIPIETKTGIYAIPSSHIITIEAQSRKVIVHTVGHDYESVHNMEFWLKVLPSSGFFQTHRSFIVNLAHVTDFDHTTVHLDNDNFCAYLTRRRYKAFKDAYLLYLESVR